MSEFDAVRSKLAPIDKARLRYARQAHAAARRRFVRAIETGNASEKSRAVKAMAQQRASARRVVKEGVLPDVSLKRVHQHHGENNHG